MRFEVQDGTGRAWDLGLNGELHEVHGHPASKCRIWNTTDEQCSEPVSFVWAEAGRADQCFCRKHGLDTFPEARNEPRNR